MTRTEQRPHSPLRRLRRVTHGGVLVFCCSGIVAFGCAGPGAAPAGAPPSQLRDQTTEAPAPGELEMREPAQRPSSQARELSELSELETIPVGKVDPVLPAHAPRKPVIGYDPPAPITVSRDDSKQRVSLREGALVLPGGFTIHRVPRGLRVYQRGERGVWDIETNRGRLVARVQAVSFRRAAASAGSLLDATRPLRIRVVRGGWDRKPIELTIDRLTTDTHIFTLERRARGTDWIWAGLELGSTAREE